MRVLGLDLSLTSTGFAFRDGETIVTGRITPNHLRGPERIIYLRDELRDILNRAVLVKDPFTLAVIEGYAMGYGGQNGNPGRVFDIGEWGGVAKIELWERGIRMAICSPGTLKIFATGSGHHSIKKPQVKAGIRENWNYDITQDDEADAFVLLMLGEATIDRRMARGIPSSRMRAADALEYLDPSG